MHAGWSEVKCKDWRDSTKERGGKVGLIEMFVKIGPYWRELRVGYLIDSPSSTRVAVVGKVKVIESL